MEAVDKFLEKIGAKSTDMPAKGQKLYNELVAKISDYNSKLDRIEEMNPEDEGYDALDAEVAALDKETAIDEQALLKYLIGFRALFVGSKNKKGKGVADKNKKEGEGNVTPPAPPAEPPVTPPAEPPVTPPAEPPVTPPVETPAPGEPPLTPVEEVPPVKEGKKNDGTGIVVAILGFGLALLGINYISKRGG